MEMKPVMRLVFLLAAFVLLVSSTPYATASSRAEALNEWIDSVRRQHNIPAMGAMVFRANTVLARGIAGVRRSDSVTPVDEI